MTDANHRSRVSTSIKYWLLRIVGYYPQHDFDSLQRFVEARRYERNYYKNALQRIADCETPSANATVRRMAKIAREALK